MTSRSTASKVMREIEELEMMKSQTHLKFLDKKHRFLVLNQKQSFCFKNYNLTSGFHEQILTQKMWLQLICSDFPLYLVIP